MTDFSDEDSGAECHYAESQSVMELNDSHNCLVDSGTTPTVLKDKAFFNKLNLINKPSPIQTLGGEVAIARGTGQVQIAGQHFL
jgi:hypothetical protein